MKNINMQIRPQFNGDYFSIIIVQLMLIIMLKVIIMSIYRFVLFYVFESPVIVFIHLKHKLQEAF